MRFLLNIGTNRSPLVTSRTDRVPDFGAEQALRNNGFVVIHSVVVPGDTEDTLVVRCDFPALPGTNEDAIGAAARIGLARVALDLGQEAIAGVAYVGDTEVLALVPARGFLMGPYADRWGAFNPAAFRDLDGRTLLGEAA